MLEWIRRSQARRFLFRVLYVLVLIILVLSVTDYYYDGRIRFSYFPHRIAIALCAGILVGILGWQRAPARNETPSAGR